MRLYRHLAALAVVAALSLVVALLGVAPITAAPGGSGGEGQGSPAEQAGGGAMPGVKPTSIPTATDSDGLPIVIADPAPPINPDFVDRYSQLVRSVARGKKHLRQASAELASARSDFHDLSLDFVEAERARGRADYAVVDAESQVNAAIRDMYMLGSTDLGVVVGVLGSTPDGLLRTLDSLSYVQAASGSEARDLSIASGHQLVATSAAATLRLREQRASGEVDKLAADVDKTRDQLTADEKELARLVAAAAPQTIVGKKGCPTSVAEGTVPEGVDIHRLCERAVAQASSPQAASAIKWALVRLGAPYACEGVGRMAQYRYDCSSYVSRAYYEAAGMNTAGADWAPSTRNMVPWDGASLDPHYLPIPPDALAPGDLVLYDTCPEGQTCPYRHVVMYLGTSEKDGVPMMAHTNTCGGVAHVEAFTGTGASNFLGVRRVVTVPGERLVLTNPEKTTGGGRGGSSGDKPGTSDRKNGS